jgi:uncharacterized membrane protein
MTASDAHTRSAARVTARPIDRLAAAGAALTLLGMIATPLAKQRGSTRRTLATAVVSCFAATTGLRSARVWGTKSTMVALATIATGTGVVEHIGTTSGVPFGAYSYTGRLKPAIGGVPAIVPLAWFASAIPAREAAHAALGSGSTPLRRVVLGAGALAAWDLFLDPQMVGEGFWTWDRRGRYRGIPSSNFVGWFLTGLVLMACLERILPPHDEADAVLAGEYAGLGVMQTIGFAAFFRDRLVAAMGGSAMLPVAAVAMARVVRRRR